MLEAGLWGLAAGSTLVVGALLAVVTDVPRRAVSLTIGFGAGALISALAFDLTAEAFQRGGTAPVAIGLAAGGLAFFVGDRLLQRRDRSADGRRTRQVGNGPSIVLGSLLDGIPEAVVLGSTLVGGAGVGLSLLVAVALSNLPEGMAAAADLRRAGRRPRTIVGIWLIVALASGVAAALGYGGFSAMGASAAVAVAQAFAAGAILAMLADTMFPEAFEGGGSLVGLATVLGFAVAFFFSATG